MAYTYKQGKLTLDADFQFADLKNDLTVSVGPMRDMGSGYKHNRITLKLNGKDITNIQSESPCGVFQTNNYAPVITIGGEGLVEMYAHIEDEVERQFLAIYNKANPNTPISKINKRSAAESNTKIIDGVEVTFENDGSIFASTGSYANIMETLVMNREKILDGKYEQCVVKTDIAMDKADFTALVKTVDKANAKNQRPKNPLGPIYFPRTPNIKAIKYDDIVDAYMPLEIDNFVDTIKGSYKIVNATFSIAYVHHNPDTIASKPPGIKCYTTSCTVMPRQTGGASSDLADMFASLAMEKQNIPINDQEVDF